MYKFIIPFFFFFFFFLVGTNETNFIAKKETQKEMFLFCFFFIMQTCKNFVTEKEHWISLDSKT
jgi:hypothetical protein